MKLTADREIWPLANPFTISRGSRTETEIVVATLSDGADTGRGECMANARYSETQESVIADLQAIAPRLADGGLDRVALQSAMPAGAARNALDCAFWDLEAKRSGRPVWALAGLPEPHPVETAYTLSLDSAENMGSAARTHAYRPVLKLKLTGDGDLERVAAVRENAPNARLIVDANEGWRPEMVEPFSRELEKLHVQLIEQPLPADADAALAGMAHPIQICADESCHTRDDVDRLAGLYDVVNIKLDKTGGLTEALALRDAALQAGLGIMVGCMVSTSLAMAPALLVAQGAGFVDLDGPLLLARDREPPMRFDGSTIHPADPALWG